MTNRTRKKVRVPETCELIVSIEGYEQTYYISEHGPGGGATSDEALIDIHGRIVSISPKHKQHLDQPLEVSFACAMSYAGNERTPLSDKPFLLPMNLRKDHRGFMAYLPAAAFWSVPGMIDAGSNAASRNTGRNKSTSRFQRTISGQGVRMGRCLNRASRLCKPEADARWKCSPFWGLA